jgi:hypothetical protein
VTTFADMYVIKNVNTRLLIFLIKDPFFAFMAASVQIPNNFFNESRDRFLYRMLWRLKACCSRTPKAFEDPTRRRRNRTLRLQNLHIETTFEIICTFVAVSACALFYPP